MHAKIPKLNIKMGVGLNIWIYNRYFKYFWCFKYCLAI